MSDVKISQLPAASAVNDADVFPIVQSGTTYKATASQMRSGSSGAPVKIDNSILVNPSNGNDSTATVGDWTKPALTIQGAINKLQAGSFTEPVIFLGATNFTENITSSLASLTIVGFDSANGFNNHYLSGNISMTHTGDTKLCLQNFTVLGTVAFSSTSAVEITLDMCLVQTISATSSTALTVYGGDVNLSQATTVNAGSSYVVIEGTLVGTVTTTNHVDIYYGAIVSTIAGAPTAAFFDGRYGTGNPTSEDYSGDTILRKVIPAGTSGQLLTKNSSTNFDYSWLNTPIVIPGGRLTTESGVPVSTSDRTSQGTLYYTPYIHNRIYTYSGTGWFLKTFSEISLSLTLTSGKNYDVFINSAATTLSLSNAWTNDTTRADALATQDGVTVLSSDHTKLWLGTIRASGTNVTEDSGGGTSSQVGGKRFVWNSYNQVRRYMSVIDTTDNWSYTTDLIRQADGASGNKVEYVSGIASSNVEARVTVTASIVNSSARAAKVGIGIDSTSTFSGLVQGGYTPISSGPYSTFSSQYAGMPGLGYHYVSWNEKGGDGTCLFLGDNGGDSQQSGLIVLSEF